MTKSKLSFLKRVLAHRLAFQPRRCPYCGETGQLELIGRKKLLLEILRCGNCLLIFRYPLDTESDNFRHYQTEYRSGSVTELPSDIQLKLYLERGFSGQLDFGPKIAALKALMPAGRVLDYGCSWGYGVRQLQDAGYDATGVELSKPRAAFGRSKLGLAIADDLDGQAALRDAGYDIIFTNHVLEHVPNLAAVLDIFHSILRDDGLLYIIVPNFTGKAAREGLFLRWIGEEHPIAPTSDFFRKVLPAHGFRNVTCGSGPFTEDTSALLRERRFGALETEGEELLVLAWRTPD